MTNEELAKRDYIVAIDKSTSMSKSHKRGGTRFSYAKEQTEGIARKCAEFDNDGIDVAVFANAVKWYNGVTPDKVEQVFTENSPNGGTATDLVITETVSRYLQRKKEGTAKPITLIIVTDGEPNDEKAVEQAIISATKQIDAREEIAISFVQVGDDAGCRKFLQNLDDGLTAKGAKFDIVDTKNEDEMENISIQDLLVAAVTD